MKSKLFIFIFVLSLSLGFLSDRVLAVTQPAPTKIEPPLEEYCKEFCQSCNSDGSNIPSVTPPKEGCSKGAEKCLCGVIGPIEPIELIDKVINWIFWIILIGSSFMVVVGALFIMMAAGKPETVTRGRSIITWALIGLAIVASARLLSAIIIRILGK